MMGCKVSRSQKEPDIIVKGSNHHHVELSSLIYPNLCNDTCGNTSSATQTVSSVVERVIATQNSLVFKKGQVPINENEIDASHFSLYDAPTIGIGGFGLVRLACKLSAGPDYMDVFAIKSISKKNVLARSSGIASVFNELACLKLLSAVNSPFICNIQYAFQNDRYLFLCMSYCSGGDLRYNLKLQPGHRFPEGICRFYIAQCLLAVDACHSVHILHRDVKPENIILDAIGYVKLTDFGVSKFFASDVDMFSQSTSGTHGYMAPEIYAKHHVHGKEVDYFAIGVTLHELCLGQRPFEAAAIRKYHSTVHPFLGSTSHGSSSHSSLSNSCTSRASMPMCYSSKRDTSELDVLRNAGLSLDLLNSAPFLSVQCKDMISGLLAFRREDRIGSTGIDEVLKHPWFHRFDWKALRSLSASAPALHNTMKLRYDARDFNSESIRDHLNCHSVDVEENVQFQDYQYRNKIIL